MKKIEFAKRILASALALLMLFAFFTSCKEQNNEDVLSKVGSSEITSSETATSEPEKEKEPESSKPETPKKPTASQKPNTETSSKSKDNVSSKPKVELPIEIPTPLPTPKPEPTPTPKPESSKPEETSKPESELTPELKSDAELLVGKWANKEDLGESLREEGIAVTGSATVTTIYEFTSNGTVICKIDEAEFMANARPLMEQMINILIVQQYQMTVDEFIAQIGMTFDEFVTLTMQATIDEASSIAEYTLNENGIYIKDSSSDQYSLFTYEFKGENELILTYQGDSQTFTRI